MKKHKQLEILSYDEENNKIVILDQTQLPNTLIYKPLSTLEDVFTAIENLEVRGAPAIGLAAAWGIAMYAKTICTDDFLYFLGQIKAAREYLYQSRPTAVDLTTALNVMIETVQSNMHLSTNELQNLLIDKARALQEEVSKACYNISVYGAELIKNDERILTYCNAGSLATGTPYGTALGPIYMAREKDKETKVYVAETRPLLQGGRLTAFELSEAGVPTTVITDNMIASVMSKGYINRVFVGCDRMAANGDFANKIGTLNVAILANYYNIPFHVCLPRTSLDLSIKNGDEIPIERRDAAEIRKLWFKKNMVSFSARIYNPAFDVTPHHLITSIIMEDGVYEAPFIFSDE